MPMENDSAIERKLIAARTRLILDKPFLGALVLRLPLQAVQADWCKTTATDARRFYYNPAYIDALKTDETLFVLAHEALHCALTHFARRQHRVKHRWDLACDYAINPILMQEGLKPPPGSLYLKEYQGMSAEEIYPCLQDNEQTETLDQPLYDQAETQSKGSNSDAKEEQQHSNAPPNPTETPSTSNSQNSTEEGQQPKPQPTQSTDNHATPQAASETDTAPSTANATPLEDTPAPPPLNAQEIDELNLQWQQRLASAAQQAQQAGKLSGILQRLVDELLQPRLSWRSLLAHYLAATARDDYSYTRPSTRRGNPAIFPTLKSHQVHATIALDVSGSVTDAELQACLSEINALKGQVRAAITLIACDSAIVAGFPQTFAPWEEVTLPAHIAGGGSTDFRPVFQWLQTQDQQPDVLIYFTDAQGYFPSLAPNYPVLWLVKGKAGVPWGIRIQLND